jgi:8-hydroxy-5-deazaflavin:NADPH oxidoreductase
MKIAVVGRGNVGGGLGDLWEKSGHDVARLGKDGGAIPSQQHVVARRGGARGRRTAQPRRRV